LPFLARSTSHLTKHCWTYQLATRSSAIENYSSCRQIDASCETSGGNHNFEHTSIESFYDHLSLLGCEAFLKLAMKHGTWRLEHKGRQEGYPQYHSVIHPEPDSNDISRMMKYDTTKGGLGEA
jgi:hypothetical protein